MSRRSVFSAAPPPAYDDGDDAPIYGAASSLGPASVTSSQRRPAPSIAPSQSASQAPLAAAPSTYAPSTYASSSYVPSTYGPSFDAEVPAPPLPSAYAPEMSDTSLLSSSASASGSRTHAYSRSAGSVAPTADERGHYGYGYDYGYREVPDGDEPDDGYSYAAGYGNVPGAPREDDEQDDDNWTAAPPSAPPPAASALGQSVRRGSVASIAERLRMTPSRRESISVIRPSPQRYPQRVTASPSHHGRFASTGGSPISSRTGTPVREWPRRPSVSYEPSNLRGSPRPGTPSSRYGGSPQRPLPPAPLFSGSRSTLESSTIDIDGKEDPFGGGGQTIRARGPRSVRSSVTESTAVGSRDSLEKVDLDSQSGGDVDDDDDDDEEEVDDDQHKMHYGPAPAGRQDRRGVRPAQMSKKQVQLINGELVLECKIPTILHSFLPRRDDREFTHMRYTAVTCDPDDFIVRGYKLRQNIGTTMRETEILVCVTMYNEDETDFARTMHGIMRNISHFCGRSKSRTWGRDGWKKIVVCVIADGRSKVHPRTLNALAAMGVYQEGIAKNEVNKRQVQAHVYEYTSQVSLDADMRFKGAEKGITPCQMIFCLKEKNEKKLNSHRWLFNAFGRALAPNVCIMLDVGTRPHPTALYHLWKAFDQDSNVAGAAGEVKASKGKKYLGLFNPLVASQNFEYKMSNILDKPIESVFGYITVLPGALSAYRFHALQNDASGHGPLSQYFKGETLHGSEADIFTANMYLAEDRILCWELVAKRNEQWVLKFVKNAVGETDVPDSVTEFISQRRRWLNGAFFAAVYSLVHFKQVWGTDHTIFRKVLLNMEFVYQTVQLIFTYFGLANFYLAFYFIAGSLGDSKTDPFGHHIGKYIFIVLRYACILVTCLQFILSMGNRPQGAKKMFLGSMIVYSVIMFYTTFCTLYMVIKDLLKGGGGGDFVNIVVSMLSTIGLYFFMSFLYLDPWHMFTSSFQYFALLPSYLCTLQIYAFCNTHDVTWGTKGDNSSHNDLGKARTTGSSTVELDMPSEQLDIDSCYDAALRNLRDRLEVPPPPPPPNQQQEDYYRAVRTYMVSIWVIANAVLAMAVSEAFGGTSSGGNNGYLAFLLWSVAALAAVRAIGSTTFALITCIHRLAEMRTKFTAASGEKALLASGTSGLGGDGWFGGKIAAATSSSGSGSGSGSASGTMSAARSRFGSALGIGSGSGSGPGSGGVRVAKRSFGEKIKDGASETKWAVKRQAEKLVFWR